MSKDVIQMAVWIIFGLFITWGVFYAYLGFKMMAIRRKSRVAKVAAVCSLFTGIFWITLWVSAVVWNLLEIVGVI